MVGRGARFHGCLASDIYWVPTEYQVTPFLINIPDGKERAKKGCVGKSDICRLQAMWPWSVCLDISFLIYQMKGKNLRRFFKGLNGQCLWHTVRLEICWLPPFFQKQALWTKSGLCHDFFTLQISDVDGPSTLWNETIGFTSWDWLIMGWIIIDYLEI